ncbi:hypothetical protein GR925_01645 [Streptomyces sp. HUCO-GS316]|uniref:hypothetical protein n=1 Tax=Streptomyces sp. HUCO-GS316 TaxID=2692198 RepID=UPI001368AC2C|nr:hypothetical protein [Streptomyces sp. HUCO-GS316]MXM62186.1 hypothetical protein [Streptomyces sp. HUCO-GS316]
MTGLIALLIVLTWASEAAALADGFRRLLAENPALRLVCQLRPHALALYLAVVIVAWPAAVIAKVLSALVDRSRA